MLCHNTTPLTVTTPVYWPHLLAFFSLLYFTLALLTALKNAVSHAALDGFAKKGDLSGFHTALEMLDHPSIVMALRQRSPSCGQEVGSADP